MVATTVTWYHLQGQLQLLPVPCSFSWTYYSGRNQTDEGTKQTTKEASLILLLQPARYESGGFVPKRFVHARVRTLSPADDWFILGSTWEPSGNRKANRLTPIASGCRKSPAPPQSPWP